MNSSYGTSWAIKYLKVDVSNSFAIEVLTTTGSELPKDGKVFENGNYVFWPGEQGSRMPRIKIYTEAEETPQNNINGYSASIIGVVSIITVMRMMKKRQN